MRVKVRKSELLLLTGITLEYQEGRKEEIEKRCWGISNAISCCIRRNREREARTHTGWPLPNCGCEAGIQLFSSSFFPRASQLRSQPPDVWMEFWYRKNLKLHFCTVPSLWQKYSWQKQLKGEEFILAHSLGHSSSRWGNNDGGSLRGLDTWHWQSRSRVQTTHTAACSFSPLHSPGSQPGDDATHSGWVVSPHLTHQDSPSQVCPEACLPDDSRVCHIGYH